MFRFWESTVVTDSLRVDEEAVRVLVRDGLEENPLLPLLAVADLRYMSPKNPPKMLRVLLSLITLRSCFAADHVTASCQCPRCA